MAPARAPRLLVPVSGSPAPCGVEAFARRLAATAGARAAAMPLAAPLRQALAAADALVLNLPVVAWKRRLAAPVAAAAAARAAGRAVVLVLHEWADLDWKRRLSYLPLLPLATAVLFSSPEIAGQFAASPAGRLAVRRRGLVPIPPNLDRPPATAASAHTAAIAAERRKGRLILGHFGSIYPKKQSAAVLDIAAALRARGADPFVVLIGSFVKAGDRVEEDFFDRVRALGLADRVLVTGYVAGAPELFGLFDQVDVFAYAFAEGLTARRGSVLACALAGRPVVVNAPRGGGAFDHHPTFRRLLAQGALSLVPSDAGPQIFAAAVLEARGGAGAAPVDVEAAWQDALASLDRILAPAAAR